MEILKQINLVFKHPKNQIIMKHLFKLPLILLVFIFSSCEKGETLESLENQSLTFDEFFEKVSSMDLQTSKENSIYIKYKWNKNNNTISIISYEEKEMSWGAALEIASLEKDSNLFARSSSREEYTVTCSNGDNSSYQKFSGKFSCGNVIAKCLEEGGCAEICSMEMEYYVPEKTFFLNGKTFTIQ